MRFRNSGPNSKSCCPARFTERTSLYESRARSLLEYSGDSLRTRRIAGQRANFRIGAGVAHSRASIGTGPPCRRSHGDRNAAPSPRSLCHHRNRVGGSAPRLGRYVWAHASAASSLDPGVNIRNVLTARTALSPATLPSPGRIRAAWDEILDRGRRVPGVQAIAIVDTVPMREGSNVIGYATTAAASPDDQPSLVSAVSVTPEYLKVTAIPLRQGRFLTDQDRMNTESVVVIDEVMAQRAFGGQDAVGKHLWIDIGPDPATVVGVVGHVRQWGLAGDDQALVRAQL